jgi:hypothetical protein
MEAAMEKMDAQLTRRGVKIESMAAKSMAPGVPAGLVTLTHIDELKALHAITRSKFEEYRVASTGGRERLRHSLKGAWRDLDAAFKKPRP